MFGATLATHGKCWVECSNGVVWQLNLADPTHRWIVYGKYEGSEGLDFAFAELADGGVFVDSGANIGQWSLYLSGLAGVHTLAFEPVDSQRASLQASVARQINWYYQIIANGLGFMKKPWIFNVMVTVLP